MNGRQTMSVLGWPRSRYELAPVATAGVCFAVLATVRIAGAYNLPLMLLSIALTPLALLVVPRAAWHRVGLLRGAPRRLLGVAVAIVLAAYLVTVVASFGAFGATDDNWLTWLPRLFDSLVPGPVLLRLLVTVTCLVLIVPLVEEVCYRGVLFDAAGSRFGPVGAVLVTSASWAVVHLGDYGLNPYNAKVAVGSVLSVFVMGLGLGICRLLTGSVLACVIAQGTANLALYGWVVIQLR